MLTRSPLRDRTQYAIRRYAVTALIGPRQCGKTTLAREVAVDRRAEYFDLEDPISQRRLAEPMIALAPLRGLVVIDEVQLRPDLFPILRVLADRHPLPARFLILGSASPELLRQGSESLAGRIALIEMGGFDLEEAGVENLRKLWWRGGFPRSYLARSDRDSSEWLANFVRTFLERDIRQFGITIAAETLRRLWMMVAHYHGQMWNASEVGRSLGEAHTTVKRHLDMLTGALMVRQLQPWFENMGQRQIKSPKVYLRDSGLLHHLLGVESFRALEGHPKIGASWEGLVVEHTARIAGDRNVYFWGTQSGAELDLLVFAGERRIGIEVKYSDAPGLTKSMHASREALGLDRLWVVYPGTQRYALADWAEVLPMGDFLAALHAALKPGRQRAAKARS